MTDSFPFVPPADMGDDVDLLCPSCGADLFADDGFLRWHVCSACGRHFSMPAQERVALLVDPESWQPIDRGSLWLDVDNDQITAMDRRADQQERSVIDEAIVTGVGRLHGIRTVVIALDDALVGQNIGALGSEKIIVALEHALAKRLPVVAIVAGSQIGSAQNGPLAVVQSARIASVATQVEVAGLPLIGILTHPTSAPIFFSFASQCDVLYAEPGTHLGMTWSVTGGTTGVRNSRDVDELLTDGVIDGVVPRSHQKACLARLLALLTDQPAPDIPRESQADSPVGVSLLEDAVELCADRVGSDDSHVTTHLGRLHGHPVALAVQHEAHGPHDDLAPALRKTQRLARMAGRFALPLVLIAGASTTEGPVLVAPTDSLAAAKLSSTIAMLPVPVVSLGVDEIAGVLGNLLMTGDRRLVVESATYHLPDPAGGGARPPRAVVAGRSWTARECERLGLVDEIVTGEDSNAIRAAVGRAIDELQRAGARGLVDLRRRRYRVIGQETEAGRDSIRLELREWQDVQQRLGDRIDDLRSGLEQRLTAQAQRLPKARGERTMPWRERPFQRPDLGDLAARLRARQAILRQDVLERTGRSTRSHSDDSSEGTRT